MELDTECERDMAYAQRVYDAAMKRSTPDVAEKLKSSWKENFGIYQEKQNLSSAPKKGWREKYGIWQKKGHTDPEMVVKEVGREPRTY